MGVKVIIKLYHYTSFWCAEWLYKLWKKVSVFSTNFLEEEFIYRHKFKVERNDNIHTVHLG
jgi:hypothetical protein